VVVLCKNTKGNALILLSILTAITTFVKTSIMIEFDQYLGFLAFLTILTIGFWLMIFLITFVIPYWLTGNLIQWIKERKAKKNAS
jgi:antibiotic biosynthesis monooxygenase (ABM) superfamily enzyme